MKRTMMTAAFILAVLLSRGQDKPNATKTKDGNYVALSTSVYKPIGKTYTDKDTVYPVYETDKGKLFVIKKSKTSGKEYRYYLKTDTK